MLAIHWTPVNNTKTVLKNGIRKSKNGLYCFPVIGYKQLDKWWVNFFNQCGAREKKKYNGIVFRIKKSDLPAYFGHWLGATNRHEFKKEITDLKSLGEQIRETILWRMGEEIARNANLNKGIYDYNTLAKLYSDLATQEIITNKKALTERLNFLDFMSYTLSDYQIVLSQSISADRIIKVLPQGNEFGRVIRQKKKHQPDLSTHWDL